MKKTIPLLLLTLSILITGCSSIGKKDVAEELDEKMDKISAYKLNGELEIVNNDDIYKYKVEASYKEDDLYKVSLTNTSNNYEQIILKNSDGVYV